MLDHQSGEIFEREDAGIYYEATGPFLGHPLLLLHGGLGDLPPPCRTNVMAAKSVNPENDGHEKEQIHRRADHQLHQTS